MILRCLDAVKEMKIKALKMMFNVIDSFINFDSRESKFVQYELPSFMHHFT